MSRFLILDIGAGTMDVLYHDSASGLHYKAVAQSPVLRIAEQATSRLGNILVTGVEMGGGALSQVLRQRAQKAEVTMSLSSAATIHHDLEKVRSWGIKVIADREAESLLRETDHHALTTGDLDKERLQYILKGLGIPFSFDVIGICSQDHGRPPEGLSHLDYRHNIFKEKLDGNPFPHTLLYRHDEVPKTLSRLTAIAKTAQTYPADEIYVMDSGMAAILGASMDPHIKGKEKAMVLDVATSHTLGAAIEKEAIAGFFEYHTRDITCERIESLLIDLADGKLKHQEILAEGGHGAYIRKVLGFEATEIIVATGPKRKLLNNARLPIILGAPLGDNMMTGTAGVIEAIRRRKGLAPMTCL